MYSDKYFLDWWYCYHVSETCTYRIYPHIDYRDLVKILKRNKIKYLCSCGESHFIQDGENETICLMAQQKRYRLKFYGRKVKEPQRVWLTNWDNIRVLVQCPNQKYITLVKITGSNMNIYNKCLYTHMRYFESCMAIFKESLTDKGMTYFRFYVETLWSAPYDILCEYDKSIYQDFTKKRYFYGEDQDRGYFFAWKQASLKNFFEKLKHDFLMESKEQSEYSDVTFKNNFEQLKHNFSMELKEQSGYSDTQRYFDAIKNKDWEYVISTTIGYVIYLVIAISLLVWIFYLFNKY
jgi:hypothetical protein